MKNLKVIENRDLATTVVRMLEFCTVVAVIVLCMTVYVQQVQAAGPEGLNQFREMAGKTAQEGNLIIAFVIASIGFVAAPCGYIALWLHRLDKYMTIRRFKKKFDQERELLERQFNHIDTIQTE